MRNNNFKDCILNIPDEEYRLIDAFSYSLLKSIDDSGPSALQESVSKTGEALTFGSLVDILLTNPENKHEVFHTQTLTKPTASLLELADSILTHFMINDLEFDALTDGIINSHIASLGIWSNIKDEEKLKAKYDTPLFWDYIRESLLAKGKIIVSPEVLENAENSATTLKSHDYTSQYFIETEDIEVIKQGSILYMFKGVQGKARMDLINVDHKNKLINVFDIKTGMELPTKFMGPFYKYKYYLQVISYLLAVEYIRSKNPEFSDYKIGEFKFIYLSKKLPSVPIIWTVPEKLLDNFMDGWVSSEGNRIKGFMELVLDYKHYRETQDFSTERLVITNKGNLKIELL
jgi:hypothetical protein